MANLLQLPRTSPISGLYKLRQPTSNLFSRYASSHAPGGEEKVKGQVIGIDLGECHLLTLCSLTLSRKVKETLTGATTRHNKLGSGCDGGKAAKDNRKRRRLVSQLIQVLFLSTNLCNQAHEQHPPLSHLLKTAKGWLVYLLSGKLL